MNARKSNSRKRSRHNTMVQKSRSKTQKTPLPAWATSSGTSVSLAQAGNGVF